ncbi:MAG: DNA mismatch endonuclease Vsr [Hymenobacter sp.]|nr:MAG: DNA mismatch endonuclease Vsr [Hymenobacter sp.]
MAIERNSPTAHRTQERVSARMARVRSKNTAPEMLVRRYLHGQGFRFKIHDSTLPGTPDIVLPRFKTVVFIQGCFWHSHGESCTVCSGAPKTNVDFWLDKLSRNIKGDRVAQTALGEAGWQVLLVWGCELKRASRGATLHRLSVNILSAAEAEASSEFWV